MAKYGKKASKTVASAMHRRKKGTLRSGSGQKVTDPKQAIAIGLSEAREKGAKVPAPRASSKRASSKRASSKRSSTKRASTARASSARGGSRKAARKTTSSSSRKTTSSGGRRSGTRSR